MGIIFKVTSKVTKSPSATFSNVLRTFEIYYPNFVVNEILQGHPLPFLKVKG